MTVKAGVSICLADIPRPIVRTRIKIAAVAIRPARVEQVVFIIGAPVRLLQFFAQAVEACRFVSTQPDAQMLVTEILAADCALAARRVIAGRRKKKPRFMLQFSMSGSFCFRRCGVHKNFANQTQADRWFHNRCFAG